MHTYTSPSILLKTAPPKYLKNLKKIIKTALVNKWITDDPFLEIHFKQTRTNRAFLTEEELGILLKKEFTIPRLQTVRDRKSTRLNSSHRT